MSTVPDIDLIADVWNDVTALLSVPTTANFTLYNKVLVTTLLRQEASQPANSNNAGVPCMPMGQEGSAFDVEGHATFRVYAKPLGGGGRFAVAFPNS